MAINTHLQKSLPNAQAQDTEFDPLLTQFAELKRLYIENYGETEYHQMISRINEGKKRKVLLH
jgi:predicted ATPase